MDQNLGFALYKNVMLLTPATMMKPVLLLLTEMCVFKNNNKKIA